MSVLPDHDLFTPHSEESVEFTDEMVRWRARDAGFMAGRWDALSKRIFVCAPKMILLHKIQVGPLRCC
jgi:hypothetical protein